MERSPGSPPQVAWLNICPPPLDCLDTSTQPPSHHSHVLLRSGGRWHGQAGRSPNLRQKVSPHCQRSRKFTSLKDGLRIFKTSGLSFGESHAHQARDRRRRRRKKKKKKHCQMVFVLPNNLENGNLRTRRAVSADLSEIVFHIHYLFSTLTWWGFNCPQFTLKS